MKTKKHIIELENVGIGYSNKKQNKPIIENISLKIEQKKLVGIIGPNGSGKSTLLRTLAKQQNALIGEISIFEKSIDSYSIQNWAKKVSWVKTESNISKNMTVKELVTLGRQPYTNWLDKITKEDEAKIEEALELTNLSKFRNKKCFTLSDGQLQRVFIARAIAQDTPIILLDEPTTHLDLHYKVEIMKLLKILCTKYEKTILFSSHEIELALQVCDSMISFGKNDVKLNEINSLISSNRINSIFNSDNFHFNFAKKAFIIK